MVRNESSLQANRSFAAGDRRVILQQMENGPLDLLIIGGGITGAGIALDAASRGLRTAVVEMQDFAAGTSSRSTKLIHGGLRYLKQLEFGLVAEVGKERSIVYENGPHVTTPEWMLLPLYAGGTFGRWSTSFGLRLYDFLAGVKRTERRSMLSAAQTLAKEPLLRPEGLKGGGYYVEYRTDDARLTIEAMKKAWALGASAVNYAKAESLVYDMSGAVTGVQVRDTINGQLYSIKAASIVNATGPWVDGIREQDGSRSGMTLRLTKGVHLVFDQRRFPLRQAIYFDTEDGRMVFAIPRDGKTYVGTTDTNYSGDIASPHATPQDCEYLLQAANAIFPSLRLGQGDIESSWAGLRPLIQQAGKDPSEISRRDEILHSPSGLISIAGGKLTGYRHMAEQVVDDVIRRLKAKGHPLLGVSIGCTTRLIPVSGGDVGGSAAFATFAAAMADEGVASGLDLANAEMLAKFYGSNAGELFKLAADADTQAWAGRNGLPIALAARLRYAMEHEMAVKPEDFMIRRTGWLFFDIGAARAWQSAVIHAMGDWLGWTPEEKLAFAEQMGRASAEASAAGLLQPD